MTFLARRVNHLGRYFLLLGIGCFLLYRFNVNQTVTYLLLGPVIHIAHWLQSTCTAYFLKTAITENIRDYGFLLPVTLFYYTLLGFLLKQLWNEKGIVKFISVFAFFGFVLFIHIWTWQSLLDYTVPVS